MRDTMIIGAGAIGLACARSLHRRGVDVAVVDRGAPGDACSSGNAGWIVPTLCGPLPGPHLGARSLAMLLRPGSPLHIAPGHAPRLAGWLYRFWRHCNRRSYRRGLEAMAGLAAQTMPLLDDLEKEAPFLEMHRAGLLFAFLNEATMRREREELRFWERNGYEPVDVLDGDGARSIEPGLSGSVVAGLFVRRERHLRPESLTSALLQVLDRGEVEVRRGVDVRGGWRHKTSLGALHTPGRELKAKRFVIAAGAWSGRLAQRLGRRLPIEAGKGYSITIDAPRTEVRTPVYLGEARVGCTPFAGSLRFAGTLEFSGVNDRSDHRRIAAIRTAAGRYLARAPRSPGREWMGMRPFAPDGLPLIGRLPGFDNVWVATGHGMVGITLALATAELVADMLTETSPDMDVGPFDPARFG